MTTIRTALFLLLLPLLALAPPAARAEEPPPPADGAYLIGANDLLELSVFGIPELAMELRVRDDGTVSIPLVGEVELAGRTLDDAEDHLAGLLAEGGFATDPQVTLFVEEYVSRSVAVQGAVRSPGVYRLLGRRTLLDMIGEAGGLESREAGGAANVIYVLRDDGAGGEERIEIDARRLVERGDPAENLRILPGDVILVPHATTRRVYVNGAVAQPGPVSFDTAEGLTLLQAITAAGGATERARLGKVIVLRTDDEGTQRRIPVDVKKIMKGRGFDVPLEAGDVVLVDEWFF